jgi:hypothetical protein
MILENVVLPLFVHGVKVNAPTVYIKLKDLKDKILGVGSHLKIEYPNIHLCTDSNYLVFFNHNDEDVVIKSINMRWNQTSEYRPDKNKRIPFNANVKSCRSKLVELWNDPLEQCYSIGSTPHFDGDFVIEHNGVTFTYVFKGLVKIVDTPHGAVAETVVEVLSLSIND